MPLLNDENEILAHYSSMALARIKSPKVTDIILESGILQNIDRAVYAIFVLGEEKDDRAVPAQDTRSDREVPVLQRRHVHGEALPVRGLLPRRRAGHEVRP